MFRRRHRLHGDFALYGGRIDPGKGCEELIEYFSSYVHDGGDASLVLMGVKLMQLPEERWVRFAGLLSERERLEALEAATVVVVPSPYESLSLLALEAFAVGTPILANARSEVLVDHCVRSNAGLFYADRDEFVEALRLLLMDEHAARRDGPQRPGLHPQVLPVGRRSWRSTTGCWRRYAARRADGLRRYGVRGSLTLVACRLAIAAVVDSPAASAPDAAAPAAAARPARWPLPCRSSAFRAGPAPPRPDVVPLDHLVQRRRLDVQQLGGALLHAAGGFERGLDQPLLEVRDDFLERDAFRRHRHFRDLERRRLADVVGDEIRADAGPVVSTVARSMTFSSSRTLPGQS